MDVSRALNRYGDPVLAGALAVFMTVEVLAWADDGRLVAVGAVLLTTLPLALRRRTPLAAFVLTMAGIELVTQVQPGFDNDSASFVIAFVVSLYSLGRYAAGVEGWLGGAALVVVMLSFVQSEGGLEQADAGDLAFVLAFAGAPWATGLTLRLRRDREAVLHGENERLRREQEERAARAVAEERARIARELHDVVSHAISVSVLQARGARRALDGDPATVRQALDAIEQTNTAALGDMRRLLAVLRDTEPDGMHQPGGTHAPQPSLGQLDRLTAIMSESGLSVSVDVSGPERELPPGVDLSAYRIVQEALTNVLKHTGAAPARVHLEYADDALVVTVEDAGGSGSAPELRGGHGLIGIRERVAVVGGDVEAGPRPGGGYVVRARLPYSVEVS